MNILISESQPAKIDLITKVLAKRIKPEWLIKKANSLFDLKNHLDNEQPYDLIIANTNHHDGLTVEVFSAYNSVSPIIFMSDNLDHVLNALKLNCVDYLVQPLNTSALDNALNKYFNSYSSVNKLAQPETTIQEPKYKDRFLVKQGDIIQYKVMNEIAYFYAEEKIVKLVTQEGRKFLINQSLDSLIKQLDPHQFYRVNRKFITSLQAIQSIKALSNSRLQLHLKPRYESDIYISKEKSSVFKKWLDN